MNDESMTTFLYHMMNTSFVKRFILFNPENNESRAFNDMTEDGYVLVKLDYADYKHLSPEERKYHILEAVQPRINFYNKCVVNVTSSENCNNLHSFYGEIIAVITENLTKNKHEMPPFVCI